LNLTAIKGCSTKTLITAVGVFDLAGKKRIIIAASLVFVLLVVIFLASAWFYVLNRVSHLDVYKNSITQTISQELNREVSYETGKGFLTLLEGLSFRFTNVVIKEKDGSSDFLNVHDAFVRIGIFPLLLNRIVLSEVVLKQPRVSVRRNSAGELNIADLLVEKEDGRTKKIRKILIENGFVTFLDQAAGEKDVLVMLEKFDARFNALFSTNRYRFQINTTVVENKNKAQLSLDGFYHPAPSKKPFYESSVRASVRLKNSDLNHYSPYMKKYTPLQQMGGYLDADVKLSGRFSDFTSKGTMDVKNGLLVYPEVFRVALHPKKIHLDYDMKRDEKSIHVEVNRVTVDRFEAQGSFGMDDLDKKDPFLKASAVTKGFVLREVRSYVPWDIIPAPVGSFIDTHVKDGNFRLIEGSLEGRISQIVNFNSKGSVDLLNISAEVKKGVFEAHPSAPLFHEINGMLELKKRRFSLKNVNARFGLSPLTMEGNISDFGLPYPTIYTAEMKLQPARGEVVWLLGEEKFRSFNFKGPSTLVLSGKGTDEDYHINARWDLATAAYAYPNVMEKPAARKNTFTAEVIINEDAVNLSSFDYNLPPVNITGSMMVRFDGKIPASFNIASKAFDLRDAAVILPVLRKLNPAGSSSLALAGRGDLNDAASMKWQGNLSVNNVSLTPSVRMKPVKGLTGNAQFKGNSVETSLLKGRIGESDVKGSFRIVNLQQPKINCQFSSVLLRVEDLGLQNPEGEINLRNTEGQFTIDEKLIHVDRLSTQFGKSVFNLSGDIQDFDNPKVNVVLTSPYVNYDDAARLMTLKYPKQVKDKPPGIKLKATLQVDTGTFKDVDFKKLDGGLTFADDTLNIETLKANIFDGHLSAKGRIDIKPGQSNHYEGRISMDKISLEKIQTYLETGDRTVTGNLSLTGDISATGRNADELKKTAAGTFEVRAEKGMLKKYSVLSKIFSLLNLYQLLKFQLPDMAKDGMPYNKITSSMLLKDGVISSENFFINSDAMEFSGAGNINFIKEELDFIVGVHPLQTIDVIAAKIPIAGWLITDENGKLITVHFKVDGTWDNPNVRPMPARSIGKGTLDIFRRIFQWPGKLITDTGEVLFGH
jgi:uncharacterized protein YhdP